MMTMNVTNSCNFYEKDRMGVLAIFVMSSLIFFGVMAGVSEVSALETEQKTRQRFEPANQSQNITGAAYEKLLMDADALIKSGRPADAYLLLEPIEFEHSGEERFDYLIGVAALDSGKADKATLALERVLMVNPNNTAARLDLARAYYQLGDMLRAKTEFTTILKQTLSEAARATTEKYLDEISAQEAGKQTRYMGYIEGAAGHDSNVNNSTSQTQVYVDSLATTVTLDPANVGAPDNYYGVAAGGEITRKLNTNWGLYVGADLRKRNYSSQRNFDALSLDARAGMTYGADADSLRVGILNGKYYLGDFHNSDIFGFNGEWLHVYSPGNQLKLFGQRVQYRFADPVMQPNDYDQQVIGGGWTHVLSSGESTLFGGLYHGTEKDVSSIIVLPATPDGGRTDGAKRFSGLRVGGQTAVNEKTTLFTSAGGQAGEYDRVNYWFQRQRSDRLYDVTVGANWHLNKLWTLRPQLSYTKNDSNIAIYDFSRTDVSINVRRDFR